MSSSPGRGRNPNTIWTAERCNHVLQGTMSSPGRERKPAPAPQHPLGHTALPPELIFDRNEPDWDHNMSSCHRKPSLQPLLRSQSYDMWGGPATFGDEKLVFDRNEPDWDNTMSSWHRTPSSQPLRRSRSHDMCVDPATFGDEQISLRSRASLLLCRSQMPDKYEVPSLNAFAMERQFKVERQQMKEKLLNPLSRDEANLRGARQQSLLRVKQATRNEKPSRIEKSVRPVAPPLRTIAVAEVDFDDDEDISFLTEEAMMPHFNRGLLVPAVNDSRTDPTPYQGRLALEKLVDPFLRAHHSNRGLLVPAVKDSRTDTPYHGCLALENLVDPFLRAPIAVIEVNDSDDEISFLSEEVMVAPSDRGCAPANVSRADPTGFQGCLGTSLLYPPIRDATPLRKRPPRQDAIGIACLKNNAESPTSVMNGPNYNSCVDPDWEGKFQRELKRSVANRSSISEQQHGKCVRFAHPLVTSLKFRPFTKPEDLPLLFFDQDDLDQLEADRNDRIPEEEFECIATPAGQRFQVSVSFPRRLSRRERQERQQLQPRPSPFMIDI